MKEQNIRIELFGYTGSGKTAFAAGLYASSDSEFAVSSDEDTKRRLSEFVVQLGSGKWPDATTISENPTMKLTINRGGRPSVALSFRDYMGEVLEKNFTKWVEKFKEAQGLLILLNPKMEVFKQQDESGWSSDCAKNKEVMLNGIKQVIDEVGKNGGKCRYIGLVVTASDLLEKHFSRRKKAFESSRKQIEDYLSTNPVFKDRWKCFEVTITGPLEDHEKPVTPREVKENNAREPVQWVINQIEREETRNKRNKILETMFWRMSCIASVASALFAGWYFWHDRQSEREIERICETYENSLRKAVQEKKQSDINRICGEMEKGLEVSKAGKTPFFATNRNRFEESRKRLLNAIELGRIAWYPMEFARIKEAVGKFSPVDGLKVDEYEKRKEYISGIKNRLEKFKVGIAGNQAAFDGMRKACQNLALEAVSSVESGVCSGYLRRLKTLTRDIEKKVQSVSGLVDAKSVVEEWKTFDNDFSGVSLEQEVYREKLQRHKAESSSIRTNMFVKIDSRNLSVMEGMLDRFSKDAGKVASEEACNSLKSEFAKWDVLTGGIAGEKTKLLEIFESRLPGWRREYETLQFKKRGDELLGKLDGYVISDVGDGLRDMLLDCKKYKARAENENADPFVPFDVRTNVWAKVYDARSRVLDVLLKDQISRLRTDQPEIPAISENDRKFLDDVMKDVLDSSEYGKWNQVLEEEVEKLKAKWMEVQKAACEKFAKSLSGQSSAYDKLKSYANFYAAHPHAPARDKLVEKLHHDAGQEFLDVAKIFSEYRMNFLNSISNDDAGVNNCDKMKRTFARLRELCNALSKIRCPLMKQSCWYDFARNCIDLGRINAGFNAAFEQKYTIETVEAKLEYKDFGWMLNHVSCDISYVTFGANERRWIWKSLDGNWRQLDKNFNWKQSQIWSGHTVIKGSPWNDAVLIVMFKEDKKGLDKEQKQPTVHILNGDFSGKTLEGEAHMDENKIRYTIHLTCDGVDFFDLLPKNTNLELK